MVILERVRGTGRFDIRQQPRGRDWRFALRGYPHGTTIYMAASGNYFTIRPSAVRNFPNGEQLFVYLERCADPPTLGHDAYKLGPKHIDAVLQIIGARRE